MAPNLIGNTFVLAETSIKTSDTCTKDKTILSTTTQRTKLGVHHPRSHSTSVNGDIPHLTKRSLEIDEKSKLSSNQYKLQIVWRNIFLFIILHGSALYGLYIAISDQCWKEMLCLTFLGIFSGFGITVGAHRLWSHKSYKAKLPLRITLMLLQSMAFQNSIYVWVRDHRVHHKFTDTNADPHNSQRGFFFSHMGWLLCRKHPDVMDKGKLVDMSDLEADPVVRWQDKYYLLITPFMCFVVPTLFARFVLGSNWEHAFFICGPLRYAISLHFTWLVNSAAHIYGMKPYDKNISPTNNKFVSMVANGEGWHNYHHVFPWDYKTAELGSYSTNISTAFIDFMAKYGLAYDLKTVPIDMIMKRVKRTGDGSHESINSNQSELIDNLRKTLDAHTEDQNIWGWDDSDMKENDRAEALITNKLE